MRIAKDAKNRLLKDSLLKTAQISSFDRRRFLKYIGTLTADSMACIDTNIHQFLFGKTVCDDTQDQTDGSPKFHLEQGQGTAHSKE